MLHFAIERARRVCARVNLHGGVATLSKQVGQKKTNIIKEVILKAAAISDILVVPQYFVTTVYEW